MHSSGDYLSTTMKATIHLEENYNHNLVTNKNTNFEELKTLFDITQKLILNQKHEINHVSTIEWQCTPLMRLPVLHDKVLNLSQAKVRVYSDRVWERCTDILRGHDKMERTTPIFFRIPMNTENYLESTKNHLSSNGIFSEDLQRCTFSKRFQNMLKIESSPCSTISI